MDRDQNISKIYICEIYICELEQSAYDISLKWLKCLMKESINALYHSKCLCNLSAVHHILASNALGYRSMSVVHFGQITLLSFIICRAVERLIFLIALIARLLILIAR